MARRTDAWYGLLLLVLLIAGLAGGCGGYRLGPSNGVAPREQAVYVQPFLNETLQPRLEDDFTESIRIAVQREGTYRLGSKSNSDILIQGTITDYSRSGLSFNPNDLVQVQDYDLIVSAHVTAFERVGGKKIFERDFSGSTQVKSTSDLASAERQAMPLVASDMAYRIVDVLADGDW